MEQTDGERLRAAQEEIAALRKQIEGITSEQLVKTLQSEKALL